MKRQERDAKAVSELHRRGYAAKCFPLSDQIVIVATRSRQAPMLRKAPRDLETRILTRLRNRGSMTRREMQRSLGNDVRKSELDAAVTLLVQKGIVRLARTVPAKGGAPTITLTLLQRLAMTNENA